MNLLRTWGLHFLLLFCAAILALGPAAAATPEVQIRLFLLDSGLEKIPLNWPYEVFSVVKGNQNQWHLRLQIPAHYAIKNSPQGPRISSTSVVLTLAANETTTKEVFLMSEKQQILAKYFLLVEPSSDGLPAQISAPVAVVAPEKTHSPPVALSAFIADLTDLPLQARVLWMNVQNENYSANQLGPGLTLEIVQPKLFAQISLNLGLLSLSAPHWDQEQGKYYSFHTEIFSPLLEGKMADTLVTPGLGLWAEWLPLNENVMATLFYPEVIAALTLPYEWQAQAAVSPVAQRTPFIGLRMGVAKSYLKYSAGADYKWLQFTQNAQKSSLQTWMVNFAVDL